MADFCFSSTAIFTNKSRQIFSIIGFSCFFFFFPSLIGYLFIASIFVLLGGFFRNARISRLLQNSGFDQLEDNPCERGAKCDDPGEFGGFQRSEELLVADHRKTQAISSSINGGNLTRQTQCRSHPPEIDKLEESPCERGEKYEDPDESFCEFGEVKRSKELLVADHRKTELISSSINGGNQTQYQSHPPRKEKEWSRTLAGKLRDDGGAGEGMDLLWEAYEKTEESRGNRRENSGEGKKKKSKKNRIVDYLEDFDEEAGENAQICCLKALKLSAGKVNFGMSKSGLLKISKSIRGIEAGWLNRKKKRF